MKDCCEKCLETRIDTEYFHVYPKVVCSNMSCKCHPPNEVKKEDYSVDSAVRDITAASVTTAAKSEVRRIVERLLKSDRERIRSGIEEKAIWINSRGRVRVVLLNDVLKLISDKEV